MNIGVVTAYRSDDEIGKLTAWQKAEYCRKRGYGFEAVVIKSPFADAECFSALMKFWYEYDWLLWSGPHCAIREHTFRVEQLCDNRFDYILPPKLAGMASDALLIQPSPDTEFIRSLIEGERSTYTMAENDACGCPWTVAGSSLSSSVYHPGKRFMVHPGSAQGSAKTEIIDELIFPETAWCKEREDLWLATEVKLACGLVVCHAEMAAMARKLSRLGWRCEFIGGLPFCFSGWPNVYSIPAITSSGRPDILILGKVESHDVVRYFRRICDSQYVVVHASTETTVLQMCGLKRPTHRTEGYLIFKR